MSDSKLNDLQNASVSDKAEKDDVRAHLQAQRDELLSSAELLLRGWIRTWEDGRHSNSPTHSTRDWISRVDAQRAASMHLVANSTLSENDARLLIDVVGRVTSERPQPLTSPASERLGPVKSDGGGNG